jgi:hypothetical protein
MIQKVGEEGQTVIKKGDECQKGENVTSKRRKFLMFSAEVLTLNLSEAKSAAA